MIGDMVSDLGVKSAIDFIQAGPGGKDIEIFTIVAHEY